VSEIRGLTSDAAGHYVISGFANAICHTSHLHYAEVAKLTEHGPLERVPVDLDLTGR